MPRLSSDRISVLLLDALLVRSGRLMASLAAQSDLDLVGCANTLAQAYHFAEHETPGLVLTVPEQVELPEFSMFSEMLALQGIDCIVLTIGTRGQVPGPSGVRTLMLPDEGCYDQIAGILADELGLCGNNAGVRREDAVQGESVTWKTVVIGASTGGIEALTQVLGAYPQNCPPTLVVQHVGPAYVEDIAARLNRGCAATVSVARKDQEILPGQVLLAPGSTHHLTLCAPGSFVGLEPGDPVSGHRPSIDRLFQSAAGLGSGAVGVLLTGMGRDGAQGLLEIRQAGGTTIGQDEESSIVYGMPRAAHELGAVQIQLPLDGIGPEILRAAQTGGGENVQA